ncbi:hypothetical protein Tco_1522119 [Tanacetum coccineum]
MTDDTKITNTLCCLYEKLPVREDDRRKHPEKEKKKKASPHIVIELVGSECELILFMRRSDYYIVAIMSDEKIYVFDDMFGEGIDGTHLGFGFEI